MSLAKGLSSALDTFTMIRDENRRSELHDLKSEYMGLRNEGARLSNRYDSTTFNDRVDEQSSNTDMAAARAGYWGNKQGESAVDLDVAKQSAPFKVLQEKYDAAYKGERVNSERALAYQRSTAGDKNAAQRRGYELDNISTEIKAREAQVTRLQDKVYQNLGPNPTQADLTRHLADQNSPVNRYLTEIAQLTYAEEIGRGKGYELAGLQMLDNGQVGAVIRRPDGGTGPRTKDGKSVAEGGGPDDELEVFPLGSVEGLMLGREDYAALEQETARMDVASKPMVEAAGARQSGLESLRAQQSENLQTAAGEDTESARAISQRLEEIDARIAAMEGIDEGSNTGGATNPAYPAGHPLQGRASTPEGVSRDREAQARLEELQASREALMNEAQERGLTEFFDENDRFSDAARGAYLSDLSQGFAQTQTNINAVPGELRSNLAALNTARTANPDATGAELAGRFSDFGSPFADRTVEDASLATNDAQMAAVRDTLDSGFSRLDAMVESIPTKGGQRAEAVEKAETAKRSAVASLEQIPELRRAAMGSPQQRMSVNVLLDLAANQAYASNTDAGQILMGYAKGRSPEAIAVGSEFANDEGFTGKVDPGLRFAVVEEAVKYVESGSSKNEAKALALDWYRQQKR